MVHFVWYYKKIGKTMNNKAKGSILDESLNFNDTLDPLQPSKVYNNNNNLNKNGEEKKNKYYKARWSGIAKKVTENLKTAYFFFGGGVF